MGTQIMAEGQTCLVPVHAHPESNDAVAVLKWARLRASASMQYLFQGVFFDLAGARKS